MKLFKSPSVVGGDGNEVRRHVAWAAVLWVSRVVRAVLGEPGIHGIDYREETN